MVAVCPVAAPATTVSKPVALTVATAGFEEVKVSPLAASVWGAPEEYVPVTVSCWVAPGASDTVSGDSAIDTRVGCATTAGELLPPPHDATSNAPDSISQ